MYSLVFVMSYVNLCMSKSAFEMFFSKIRVILVFGLISMTEIAKTDETLGKQFGNKHMSMISNFEDAEKKLMRPPNIVRVNTTSTKIRLFEEIQKEFQMNKIILDKIQKDLNFKEQKWSSALSVFTTESKKVQKGLEDKLIKLQTDKDDLSRELQVFQMKLADREHQLKAAMNDSKTESIRNQKELEEKITKLTAETDYLTNDLRIGRSKIYENEDILTATIDDLAKESKKVQKELEDKLTKLSTSKDNLATELMVVKKDLKYTDEKWSAKLLEMEDLKKSIRAIECHGLPERCDRSDYNHTPGIGFHKLYSEPKTWSQAREACEEDDGHLVVINTKSEEKLLVEMLNTVLNHDVDEEILDSESVDQAWIGIRKRKDEWITVFGSQPVYKHWGFNLRGKQEPHDCDHECAALYKQEGNGMGSQECFKTLPYICEL